MADHPTSNLWLVEDEANVGSTLAERLRSEGFTVTWSTTAAQAWSDMRSGPFDLALLDVGLPDGSGFDVGKELRKTNPSTAIIFLTAFGDPDDRIQGLELGAEDYVVKPFHLKELMLRIRNVIRRAKFASQTLLGEGGEQIQVGRAEIHFTKFEAKVGGTTQSLTHKELALLKLLVEKKGQVISRDEILDRVWSEDDFPTPRTVDNFIMRLRRLVEVDPEHPQIIKSVRGVGYQLV